MASLGLNALHGIYAAVRCSFDTTIDDHTPEQWGGWPAGGWGGEELLGKVIILRGLWELQGRGCGVESVVLERAQQLCLHVVTCVSGEGR